MSPQRKPRVELVRITPERAREILTGNTHNRKIRHGYVARLADAIRRGEWELNGEPIQIGDDGTLLNGQHRLLAIVQAGVPVDVVAVIHLPISSQDTIDTGSRRRLSDVLALRGEVDANNLAAALTLLHRYRIGARMDNSGQTAPTPHQALELLEREPHLRASVKVGRKVNRETGMSATVATVLYHLFLELDERDAEEFFRLLVAEGDLATDSPIWRLKAILRRVREDPNYRPTVYTMCAMTIKAFNAWRQGRPMSVLAFRPGGASPEPFPKIERVA
jgi:hypothetical protein